MALPKLTDEQRRENLAKAMEARHARAEALAMVRDGRLTLEGALETPALARCRLLCLLCAVPGIGESTAKRCMYECAIAECRRVSGMTAGQRQRLLVWVDAL